VTVHEFPRRPRPIDREMLGRFRATFTAEPLTREALLAGPIDAIREPGPWVATGDLADALERLVAIGQALQGPGRVNLADGAYAIAVIIDAVLRKDAS
jgi:hypothetical protein